MELGCSQRPGQRRIGVAINYHRVRILLQQHRFNSSQHRTCLRPVEPASNSQVIVRGREVKFLEEGIRHPMVVVLPGVDKNLLMALPKLIAEWADLDELRAGADDGQRFHATPGVASENLLALCFIDELTTRRPRTIVMLGVRSCVLPEYLDRFMILDRRTHDAANDRWWCAHRSIVPAPSRTYPAPRTSGGCSGSLAPVQVLREFVPNPKTDCRVRACLPDRSA